MKKVHFCIFYKCSYKIELKNNQLINVSQVRGYVDPKKIKLSYNQIVASSRNINTVGDGKTVAEIIDFDHIVQLINNFYNKKDLLYNITLDETHLEVCKNIDDYYNKPLDYDCICFSSFRPFLFHIIYAAIVIKRKNPNTDIMVGGSLIELSKRARDLLTVLKDFFDYVVKGDVEVVIDKYVNDCLSKDNHIVEYIDMTQLPMPIYRLPEIVVRPYLYFSFSRGCPYPCTYCPGGHRKLKFIPTKQVVDTFKYYNKLIDKVHTVKRSVQIFFTDNTTNFTRKRIDDICDGLIDSNNELDSDAFFTFKNLDEDLLDKLKKAKFYTIKLGIDTYSEGKNELYHNKTKYAKENIYPILDKMKNIDLALYGKPGIYGMPGETTDMFEEELKFLIELQQKYKDVPKFKLMPYMFYFIPGTRIYNNPADYGVIYEYWNNLNCVISEVNEIAEKTPRYYFCNISQEEYINRYLKIRNLSPFFRCAEVEDYMVKIGYNIIAGDGC